MDGVKDGKLMKFSSDSDPSSSSDLFNNHLGEGLLLEILGRLPSRAATRLKLVCKSWCSLISSQYFITFFNHRRHGPSPPGFIFQTVPRFRRHFWIVCGGYKPDLCGSRRLDLSFLPKITTIVQLKGWCGDLILCSTTMGRTKQETIFYICNHLTKHWAALPPAPKFQFDYRFDYITPDTVSGFLCVPAPCSLCSPESECVGVDNSHYDFVVVRICIYVRPDKPFELRVQLFFSEEAQWRKTLVVSSPRPIMGLKPSPFFIPYKGMLHLEVYKFILVYDPYNSPERFSRVIDMPAEIKHHIYVKTMGVFRDRLRVIHAQPAPGGTYSIDPIYYVWELEDYNMGKWSLVRKIHITTSLLDPPHLHPNPKIRETGFHYSVDRSAFYWTSNSSSSVREEEEEEEVGWPTPPPSLACTTHSMEALLGIHRQPVKGRW